MDPYTVYHLKFLSLSAPPVAAAQLASRRGQLVSSSLALQKGQLLQATQQDPLVELIVC